jgi:hypothetical protein
MKRVFMAALGAVFLFSSCSGTTDYQVVKPRTIVCTDGEVDDYDSFIRLLLYANEMSIEAIVYSASQWHWAGDGNGTPLLPENRADKGGMNPPQFDAPKESHRWIGTQWIPDLIDAYGEVWPNLVKHDASYPSAEHLKSLIKVGNIRVEGDMSAPTEGSEAVKAIMLDDKPGPVYFQAWGGTNTFARALLSIEEEYRDSQEWDAIYKKVCDKMVLYIIQDQDGTYMNYVAQNWPGIKTIYNANQFISFAYLWKPTVPEPWHQYLKGEWFRENIVNEHGPLTAKYLGAGIHYPFDDPEDHYGDPELVRRTPGADFNDFISEGDSPSFFFLFDFWGLRSLDHPEWGSIGGRFNEVKPGFWEDPQTRGGFRPFGPQPEPDGHTLDREAGDFNPFTSRVDMMYPQTRWVEVLQNDFAARADWCVTPYEEANHAPSVKVNNLGISAKPGEKVSIKANASDPDGDRVEISFWQYREAGTSDALLEISQDGTFSIPADVASGTSLHIIVQATDSGTPSLTRYQRVIVTVL